MLPSQVSTRSYATAGRSWPYSRRRMVLAPVWMALVCAVWINAEIQARPKPMAELFRTAGSLHFQWIPRRGKTVAQWGGYLASPGGTTVRLDCRAICALGGAGEAAAHPFEGKQASVLWAVRYHPVFFNTIDDIYEMKVEGREVVAYDPDFPKSGGFPWLARGMALLGLCGLVAYALQRDR